MREEYHYGHSSAKLIKALYRLLLSCLILSILKHFRTLTTRPIIEKYFFLWDLMPESLPNLLLCKIKSKQINKFEGSMSTKSHLAYKVLDVTENWECCFLKRRGEPGLLREKNSQRPTCGVAYGIHEPEPHWWGWGGGVNALTTAPKHFPEVLYYSYPCSNHKLRPSWKCDHAIPKGQCAGIGIWLAG